MDKSLFSKELIDKERLGVAIENDQGLPEYKPVETDEDVIRRFERDYFLNDKQTELIPFNKFKEPIKL